MKLVVLIEMPKVAGVIGSGSPRYSLWFGVWGLRFRVQGLGFRVSGLGFRV